MLQPHSSETFLDGFGNWHSAVLSDHPIRRAQQWMAGARVCGTHCADARYRTRLRVAQHSPLGPPTKAQRSQSSEPPRGFEPRTYALRVRCSTPKGGVLRGNSGARRLTSRLLDSSCVIKNVPQMGPASSQGVRLRRNCQMG